MSFVGHLHRREYTMSVEMVLLPYLYSRQHMFWMLWATFKYGQVLQIRKASEERIYLGERNQRGSKARAYDLQPNRAQGHQAWSEHRVPGSWSKSLRKQLNQFISPSFKCLPGDHRGVEWTYVPSDNREKIINEGVCIKHTVCTANHIR